MALTNRSGGTGPRALTPLLVGLIALAAGYFGQGSWAIGARPAPSATSATVTDVVGGADSRQPVRVQVRLAVINAGPDRIRVLEPLVPAGSGAGVEPGWPARDVEPGRIGWVDLTVALDCRSVGAPQLPDLQLELRDGTRTPLPVTDTGLLLEACARSATAVRPVAVTDPAVTGDGRLSVRLSSPTGRRVDVVAIRAGGVPLTGRPLPATVTGRSELVVRLEAPAGCRPEWRVSGLPSAVSVDLAPEPGSGARAAVQVRLGPVLTSWLLATSCQAG